MRLLSIMLAVVVLAASATGCGSKRDIKITDQNKTSILADLKNSKDFTVEEVQLIISRQLRASMAAAANQPGPAWVGQTLQQVIDDERKLVADAKAKEADAEKLAAEAKAKEDVTATELRKTINLTVFDKGFRAKNISNGEFDSFITIKVTYANTSAKDVRAFQGLVRFTNLFDQEIYSTSLTIETPIKAGEKNTWTGYIKYNQFSDEQQRLGNTELANMRVVWIPRSILFADGTQIGEK